VERLTHGLQKAKENTTMLTQTGAKKVNGSKTILEQHPPNSKTLKALKAAIKQHEAGQLSCRNLRDVFKGLLKLKRLGTMTAMRMVSEIKVRYPSKR